MSGVLFLAHRLPFPPDRGDKIRSHHILKALAALAPVEVGCFAESPADFAHADALANMARHHCMPLRRAPIALAGLKALMRREPVSLSAFGNRQLARWVAERLASGEIDTVYVFSGQMGQFVPPDWAGRLIVDLVDVDSAKFEAYAAGSRGPARWINRREARLLSHVEANLAARADRTLLVSEAEADVLRARAPGIGRIEALPNGIDAAAYDPGRVARHPELTARSGPHIVFTGQMDYAPNVAAAMRTIERLLPAVRHRHPNAKFHVVGRAPTAALRAHHGSNGVHVWGAVPDVRPFLASADLALVPLEIARGVQNKVLEAMAMAVPVVLTPAAATGIEAVDGRHFAIGASDAALVSQACALLDDRPRARAMGLAARKLVVETMSWDATLSRLARLIGRPAEQSAASGARHAA